MDIFQGPYQHGGGFKAADGSAAPALFGSNIPISVTANPTGVSLENVFASEFGCSVFSSFESMSPTLEASHWGVHAGMPAGDSNPMSARNCTNILRAQGVWQSVDLIEVFCQLRSV